MRDKLGDRGHQRSVGQVDPRISGLPRRGSEGAIPLTVGTPVVWIDWDDYDMTTPGAMAAFTDRMGVAWSVTASATGLIKCLGGLNGRNCVMSAPAGINAATCMQSAAVTTGDVSVFWVFREILFNGSFPCANPVMFYKGTFNQEWCSQWTFGTNLFFRYKVSNNADYNPWGTSNQGGQVVIFSGRGSAAAGNFYQNGTVIASSVPTAGVANTSSPIFLGGYDQGLNTNPCWCQFGEIIVYGSYLSDAARQGVERYLGRKYGITVA